MCNDCDFFQSYQDIYEDEEEDSEVGICYKNQIQVNYDNDNCDHFKLNGKK
jgi:hypothetical protein